MEIQAAAEMFIYMFAGLGTLAWLASRNSRAPGGFTAAAVILLWPLAWILVFFLWFASEFNRLKGGLK